MSWHKNDKNNAVWYLSFLLNQIVNKRVSLSSIFLQCFVVKHWEMLAVPGSQRLSTAVFQFFFSDYKTVRSAVYKSYSYSQTIRQLLNQYSIPTIIQQWLPPPTIVQQQ